MSLDFELLKAVLGIFSIVGGTVSGIAALLVDYRDKKTGKITKWGRYALLGVGGAFLIGTSNLWLDYTQKTREAREAANKSREAAEKTLRIVTDIGRTLSPLKDVQASYCLIYPFDQPELAQYRQRLDQGVRALLPKIGESDSHVPGVVGRMRDVDGTITQVSIGPNSPLFPDHTAERFAYTVLADSDLELMFYKIPIDPALFGSAEKGLEPDISMSFEPSVEKRYDVEVGYDLETKTISHCGNQIRSDQTHWDSSGKILSPLDLPGSQLFIRAGHSPVSFAERDKRVEPHLQALILKVAERRAWLLRDDKLKPVRPEIGEYVYTFPKTYNEMLEELDAK
jgi:hypothetical protein